MRLGRAVASGAVPRLHLSTLIAGTCLVATFAVVPLAAPPAHGTADEVLILDVTVIGGASSLEAAAVTSAGFTPHVVNAAEWGSMTTADFASYRGIVLGDPNCGDVPPAVLANTAGVWGPAVDGNVLLVGTDPMFHEGEGGDVLTNNGISFAVAQAGKTGLYATLSCYYHDTADSTPVPILDGLDPGAFTVRGVGCYNDVHIVATHPAMNDLTDAALSNWACSVHEGFDTWPASFQVVAIAENAGGVFTAPDGTVGVPYILGRGAGLSSIGIPLEQTFGMSGTCNCSGADNILQWFTNLPVNTATGALTEQFVDASLPGVGVPFAFTRTYTSADTATGPLGVGWSHPFLTGLTEDGSGQVVLRAEDGQRLIFTPEGGGSYITPPGARSTLVSTPTGWLLTKPDQATLTFNADGQLTGTRDRVGEGLTLTYVGDDLDTVVDSAGRVISFEHTGGRLTKMTLPGGRYVGYEYTAGRLTSVRDLRGKTTTYAYDSAGLLESLTDPLGHMQFHNVYGPNGRVVEQTDARNKTTTFAWNAATQTATRTDPRGNDWSEKYQANVLRSVTDPLGHTTSFDYDNRLNRTAVTDPRGKVTRFTYAPSGNMLTKTAPEPLSYVETWTYTPFNSVETFTNRRGKTTTYEYYPDTQLVKKVTDPLNRATSFTYTELGQVDTIEDARGKVTNYDYGADGNLTWALSPEGNVTTFGYDSSGRRISMVEPRGNVSGTNPADFTTEYDYDDGDLLLSVTDPLDHVTAYAYDDAGNLDTVTNAKLKVTNYDYNDTNQVTKVTDPRGGVTESEYDDNGNLVKVTTPEGVTTWGYDDANRRVSEVTPRGNAAGANPVPFTWTYGYDANGNLETETNPTAGTTTQTYDELNRRKTTTDALGESTVFGYDANSNLTSIADPLNRVTSYEFDDADQLDRVTDASLKVTDYGYDGSGNRNSLKTSLGFETTWTYDGDGRLATEVDPRGNVAGANPAQFTTDYDYDPAGHLKQVTDPLNHATTYDYDRAGNLKTRTDANNHATTYGYDPLNMLETVTGPATTNVGITGYTYDDSGNLHTRTDANNRETTYDHDLAGRLTTKTTPIGVWTYDYDHAGNLTTTTTAAGNATPAITDDGTITRTYDPVDRLTGIDYSGATPDVTYTHDELRLQTMVDDTGGTGTESYGYDVAGQLKTITRGSQTIGYDYDPLGHVTSRSYSGGPTVTQSWDDDGRPLVLTDPAMSVATSWDEAGNLKTRSWGTGSSAVTETRSYDNAGRPTMLETLRANNFLVSRHEYTYDNVGNPLNIARKYGLQGEQENFTYDDANRLTRVCYAVTCLTGQKIIYTYDPLGNRLTENRTGGTNAGIVTSTYDPDTDQLVQTSRPGTLLGGPIVTDYAYDANGNQTQTGGRTFTYDLENRTTSTTSSGSTTGYSYDGNGQRLSSTTTGTTTSYRWDPNYPLPELASETTAGATRRYIDDATGDPVGIVIPGTGTGTGPHNLHTDALGSVGAATDVATAATRGTWAYEPFGTNRSSPTNQNNLANPVKFAGEYQDSTTGLYHLRARDYDSTTGRFNALDPLAQDTADTYVSDYLYVRNQPTVMVDPSGKDLCPGWDCDKTPNPLPHLKDCASDLVDCAKETAEKVGNEAVDTFKASTNHIGDCYNNAANLFSQVCGQAGLDLITLGTFEDYIWPNAVGCADEVISDACARLIGLLAGGALINKLNKCFFGVKPVTGIPAAKSVDDVLGGLAKGKQSGFKTVESDSELQDVYNTLSRGGTPIEVPGYKGSWVERPDGIRIGLRDASKTGGRTIDVRYPDGTVRKVHIE